LARFNWGTSEPDTVDEFLRDKLGCYKRGPDKRFVITADIEPGTPLLIPVAYAKPGLAVDQTHVLRVKKQPRPPRQFETCAEIAGVTFEFDKSFVRPSVVGDLEVLQSEVDKHPAAKIMIWGHTDKVGSEAYNKELSERRAKSVYAFITNQPDIWEELYKKENWGIRAVQEILKDMGGPYDPGAVDGVDGPNTRQAVKNFQTDHGLTVDGVAGPNTRNKLFTEYMSGTHDIEIDDARFMDPKHMGCGEFNPMVETEAAEEKNRRVTFYLFHEERLPTLPCAEGDLAPCQKQTATPLPRHKDSFHCSFYDSIARNCKGGKAVIPPVVKAWLAVQIFFHEEPVKELEVTFAKASGGKIGTVQKTDDKGVAKLDTMYRSGNYLCRIEAQHDAVITTVASVDDPFQLVLPIGRPLYEYDMDPDGENEKEVG
jgi:outer membrane protein OmpA-like peptidoglycan-associated protein